MATVDKGTMSTDERAIRDLVANWMEASKRNDLAALLDLMSDDILFLVPGRQPFGKAEFIAASEGMNQAGAKVAIEGTADIQEIEVLGNWAWLRNFISVRVTPPGDVPSRHHAGHTLSIFRKGPDGRWRLFRDANLVMALDPAAASPGD